jgi:hypothetical protein
VADLVGHFGEILVLAEEEGHVEGIIEREPHDVERQPDVDPFLMTDQGRVLSPVRGA